MISLTIILCTYLCHLSYLGVKRVGIVDGEAPLSPSSGENMPNMPKQLAECSFHPVGWKLIYAKLILCLFKISKTGSGYYVWDVNWKEILLPVQIRLWGKRSQKEGAGISAQVGI